jgi:lipopolysaccharide assembly outer membrane protein LptD (OstA)
MNVRWLFSVCVILLLCVLGIRAIPQAAKPAPAAVPSVKPAPTRELYIQFISAEEDEKAGLMTYQSAIVKDGDEVIKADKAVVHLKTKVIDATGNLNISDPQADATGDSAKVYYARDKRLAVLLGHVRIVLKPEKKPEAEQKTGGSVSDDNTASLRSQPSIIICDKMEYEFAKDKKHATLTGNFKVTQQLTDRTRTLTADHAEWFGLEDKVTLYPPVHLEDTRGMKGDTEEPVTIITTGGQDIIKLGKGSATIPVQEDEGNTTEPLKK